MMFILFGFLFPGFLWMLALISVPLVIHLFYFRRYKKQYFSNVLLLKQLQEQRSTRNNLMYWLVLATRLLIVILLVFAFSQPFLGEEMVEDGSKWTSIYLDNSFSMSLDDGSGSLLSKAIRSAKEHVENNASSIKYQIITNEVYLKNKNYFNKQEAIETIDRINLSSNKKPSEEIYNQQLKFFEDKKGQKQIIWYSDFQKNRKIEAMSEDDIKHYSYQVTANNINNIYVDTCWIDPPFAELGRSTSLIVELQSDNASFKKRVMRMEISLNDEIKAIKNIKLDEEKTLDTTSIVFNNASWNQIKIKLEDYPYIMDNTYYACFKVSEKIRVLSVFDQNESKAIDAVLKQENIHHDQMQIDKLDMKVINDYSLIILDGINRLSENMITALSQHIKSSGDIVVFPSENIDAASYKRLSKRLGVGYLTSLKEKQSAIFSINLNSRLLNRVFKKIPENVSWPNVKNYFPITHMSNEIGESIMSFSDKGSLAYEYKKEMSRIFLFSIGTDTFFSDLSNNSIFPPLLYNMVLQSEEQNNNQYMLGNNYSVPIKYLKSFQDDKLKLVKDEFELLPSFRYMNGEKQLLLGDNISEMGFYSLKNENKILSRIAFNHDKEESKLEYYKGSEINNYFDQTLDAEDVVSATLNENKTELWKVCIIFVLSLIIVETIFLKYL